MIEYEKWWDKNVVTAKYTSMDKFKEVLDRNKSRYEYLKIIEEINPKSVLDVGCGLGLDYEMYKSNNSNINYCGIDACKGFIEENKKNYPEADFRLSRAQELPFEDNSFDLVTCRGVLEHLDEPYKAISEIARVSKHDVVLIWFLIPGKKEKITLDKQGYYRNIYSENKIMNCLKENGLELGYNTVIKDKKSPMKRHEVWVLKKCEV
jgi:ubiquinone/menaquinone biosynthesis C-methylase UbiE